MAIITLTTDWHKSDYYISALKGRIMSLSPMCTIVDVSHNVTRFNASQAAFIISGCYKFYPEKSIHILCVSSEVSDSTPHVIVYYNKHYFIGADNGQFGLICETDPEWVIRLPKTITNAPEIDIFAVVAAQLHNGKPASELGNPTNSINQSIPLLPTLDSSIINGSIVYTDSFGNAITNISRENFEHVAKGRPFEILVQSNHYKITQISKQYNDAPEGELLALFNSLNLLEIAIRNGFVAEILNLKINAVVRIRFFDNKPANELLLM